MPKKLIDINTQKKIRKHLKDKNDTITDADIKNAKTNFSETDQQLDKQEKDKKVEDATGPGIDIPWNILGE